jgi:hypothetical protein
VLGGALTWTALEAVLTVEGEAGQAVLALESAAVSVTLPVLGKPLGSWRFQAEAVWTSGSGLAASLIPSVVVGLSEGATEVEIVPGALWTTLAEGALDVGAGVGRVAGSARAAISGLDLGTYHVEVIMSLRVPTFFFFFFFFFVCLLSL